jgi:MSHA pilin protein MshC
MQREVFFMKPSRFAFQAGFTLIELIMVVVLLGVLAVFAAPRILNTGDFYARGFHDETQAYLRYAQKTAIAQRRTVCVTFASTSVSLAIASAPATSSCAAAGTLKGPKGESPATATARSGVAFTSTPTSFNFDGLGQPITSAGNAQATQVIQVSGVSKSITVETETGYVHE